ncbi:hypothetical protein [Aliiroseovarius sp.]|uniref:hypothetical protein n=1 Tax=Aliiroseovarius sp. TaxID=1872442 RepID=UPI003BAAAE1A
MGLTVSLIDLQGNFLMSEMVGKVQISTVFAERAGLCYLGGIENKFIGGMKCV